MKTVRCVFVRIHMQTDAMHERIALAA